jgi:23S rRNA pseudouridine1911/1915/1917 synthase
LSGRLVQEALELGLVRTSSGSRLSKGSKLPVNEPLDFTNLSHAIESGRKGNAELQIEVLFEDFDIWVVDKPAGVPGHPLRLLEIETVTHWAFARSPDLRKEFQKVQPTLTPHRLDTGTSGVLIVARSQEAYQAWRHRFDSGTVRKSYLAWCWGAPSVDSWLCSDPIGKAKGKVSKWAVGGSEPRPAISRVKVLEQRGERFLAEILCDTGVTHQVRVHLAHSGFPLVGDASYDPGFLERPFHPSNHWLRAHHLTWEHFRFSAPTDEFRRQ